MSGSHPAPESASASGLLANEAAALLDNLNAHDVLFWPMGDVDSTPVRRAAHLVNVFVVCDWRWPCSPNGFERMMRDLMNNNSDQSEPATFDHDAGRLSFEMPVAQVQAITGPSTDFGLFHEPAWSAGQQPWGRVAHLQQPGSGRGVWFVYIVGDAVEVYQNLFVERGSAPKVLWLDPPLGADLDGWAQFISPAGEFGRIFTAAAQQPEYVVAQRCHPGWKHLVPCQRVRGWHHAADLTLFALPGSERAGR